LSNQGGWKWRVCSTNREIKNAYRILIGKPEENRPLIILRHRLVDNVDNTKMDLGEREWDCVDWIDLAQDRNRWSAAVNTVMNFMISYSVGMVLSGCIAYSMKLREGEVGFLGSSATCWASTLGLLVVPT
jgi:hypothetical protein